MRTVKIVAGIAGIGIALLLLALVAVWAFVNPNDYKDRIATAVEHSTGRTLSLPGQIKLSVFPWIALELGPASLGNPPGFGDAPFAAVKHAVLRVRLWPLLRKRLEIGRIEIDGLDLQLRKKANSQGNWESFGPKESASAAPGGDALQDLAGLLIRDSRIAFEGTIVDHLSVTVGHLHGGAAVPVTLALDLRSSADATVSHIESQFNLTPDFTAKRYDVAALQLHGSRARGAAAPFVWDVTAPTLQLNLAAQTLATAPFQAQIGAARVEGTVAGQRMLDAPVFSGTIKLAPVDLRGVLSQLGIAAPAMRDPRALSTLSAQGNFRYGGNALSTEQLTVVLDQSTLSGAVAISDLDKMSLRFDLSIDHIDVDRYRSPATASRASASAADAPKPAPSPALDAEGTLKIGAATVAGVTLTHIDIGVRAHDGVTTLAPANAQLYGGQCAGSVTLDSRSAPSRLSIEQNFTSIDVAQLLNAIAKTRRLSGRGNVTAHLTTRGTSGDELIRSLNGQVAARLANGAVEGIDLGYEIRRAQSVLQQQTLPTGSSTGRTPFDKFQASAQISNGIATTKDLDIMASQLRVTGQGITNLNSLGIDYRLKATLLKSAAGAAQNIGGLSLQDVPVKISGTLTNPTIRPDLEGVAKARVEQELNKHKDELKQKLQDIFKR